MFNLRFVFLFSFGLSIQPFCKIVAAEPGVVKPSPQVFSLYSLYPKALYPSTACRCLNKGECCFTQLLNILEDNKIFLQQINELLECWANNRLFFKSLFIETEYDLFIDSFQRLKAKIVQCDELKSTCELPRGLLVNTESSIKEVIKNTLLLHDLVMRGGKNVSSDSLDLSTSSCSPSGMPSPQVRRPQPVRGGTQKFAATGDDFSKRLSCGECSHCGTRGFHNSSVCPNLNANLVKPA